MKIVTAIPPSFFEHVLDSSLLKDVEHIVQSVREEGDKAVKYFSQKFGDGNLETFLVDDQRIESILNNLDDKTKEAINYAIDVVKQFAGEQLKSIKNLNTVINGVTLGHRIIPIERVGVYVPGGNYPLPSSAIMTIVPARVAGVKEIIMCSPKISDVTIAAGILSGADKIYTIGGAQAIAAMAYGTESIPKVDKICGPGNIYVNNAKMLVSSFCGIDMYAGPSEVLIIADDSANPELVAADLLAQAEHDVSASAHLITTSYDFASKVKNEVLKQLSSLNTRAIAEKSIENSYIIVVENIQNAIEIANNKAPEHLEIIVKDPGNIVDQLNNYGSLFIGSQSAEVFGDYCSGTNHVLPTAGSARFRGGLSVFDYIKIATYQSVEETSPVASMIKTAMHLANLEGLAGHARAAEKRLPISVHLSS